MIRPILDYPIRIDSSNHITLNISATAVYRLTEGSGSIWFLIHLVAGDKNE